MIHRTFGRIFDRHPSKVLYSLVKMSSSTLESIKEVDIDPKGTFKYILIKVYGAKSESEVKMIVRGYKRCPYHENCKELEEKLQMEFQNKHVRGGMSIAIG